MAFSFGNLDIGALSNNSLIVFIVIFCIISVVALGIAGFFVVKNNKKYKQFICVIYGLDGYGNRTITYDDAGIFIDGKTQNKRFYMKKANVGLCPDNVPAIADSKHRKVVFLQQIGLKNFRFIKIGFNKANDFPVLEVTEEDVNWGVNAYEKQKKFNNSTLMQLIPYIALIMVSLVIMVVFIYFFKDFSKLENMAYALSDTAHTMLIIQNNTMMQNAVNSGTTFIN